MMDFKCSESGNDIVVKTPFVYPDGNNIHVLLVKSNNKVKVTDNYGLLNYLKKVSKGDLIEIGVRCLCEDINFVDGEIFSTHEGMDDMIDAIFKIPRLILNFLMKTGL
jgi:hypothetical protein